MNAPRTPRRRAAKSSISRAAAPRGTDAAQNVAAAKARAAGLAAAKLQAAHDKAAGSRPARAAARDPAASYHHGDLHEGLLQAAEMLLERDGLAGLTLRAVAREAGVSHAAPAHHFGDLGGLVSELAAIGFRRFNATMIAAAASGTTPLESALARAKAYLAYAQARPGMYRLMFRTEWLDFTRPGLREASNASFAGLASVAGAPKSGGAVADALTIEQGAQIARTWSLVHGFTMLTLDGRLNDILKRLPDGADAEALFVEMLKITVGKAG